MRRCSTRVQNPDRARTPWRWRRPIWPRRSWALQGDSPHSARRSAGRRLDHSSCRGRRRGHGLSRHRWSPPQRRSDREALAQDCDVRCRPQRHPGQVCDTGQTMIKGQETASNPVPCPLTSRVRSTQVGSVPQPPTWWSDRGRDAPRCGRVGKRGAFVSNR